MEKVIDSIDYTKDIYQVLLKIEEAAFEPLL